MIDQHIPRSKASIVYFSHGGGPMPILGDASHRAMVDFMQKLPTQIRRPDAIIVISAHWEEQIATIIGAENPELFYDYYGFPPSAYSLKYPVPGNPELARKIAGLLSDHNIQNQLDSERGFDHGLFIPLKLMYPEAGIPAVQLSLLRGLDPQNHIALGRALQALNSENILVIGSGFSFHNMPAFSWRDKKTPDPNNNAFQDWLIETCGGSLSPEERENRLLEWQKAPSARYCHPREEHLLPLHVCMGIADRAAEVIFDDYILGKRAVAFLW